MVIRHLFGQISLILGKIRLQISYLSNEEMLQSLLEKAGFTKKKREKKSDNTTHRPNIMIKKAPMNR